MKTLQDFQKPFEHLLKLICAETEFQSEIPFEDIIRQPRLVVVVNHATALSWIPAMCMLTQKAIEAGGADRKPRGVVDRWFYTNPLTSWIANQVTQSPTPLDFQQLIEHFKDSSRTDLIIFPEGANTFFGEASEVQEFRSPKFVEIAIRCQAPILIVAHKGSEVWGKSLQLPDFLKKIISPAIASVSDFFAKALLNSEQIQVPFVSSRIPRFKMRCHLYLPALYEADLSDLPDERKAQLQNEADHIREIMIDMLEIM